jgi:hypothetical protein
MGADQNPQEKLRLRLSTLREMVQAKHYIV